MALALARRTSAPAGAARGDGCEDGVRSDGVLVETWPSGWLPVFDAGRSFLRLMTGKSYVKNGRARIYRVRNMTQPQASGINA
jgi:hypothetical protein